MANDSAMRAIPFKLDELLWPKHPLHIQGAAGTAPTLWALFGVGNAFELAEEFGGHHTQLVSWHSGMLTTWRIAWVVASDNPRHITQPGNRRRETIACEGSPGQ